MLFILVSCVYITNKLPSKKIKKMFLVIHKPLGYGFILLATIHLIVTISLFNKRPVIIYILGIAMLVIAIISVVVFKFKQIKVFKYALLIHKLCAILILILLIIHIYFCFSSLNAYQKSVSEITFSEINLDAVSDGEYIGECNVGYIYAKVKVMVNNGVISNITILQHRNERGQAGEYVVEEILSKQLINVDAISGATNSSKVIKKAVENALKLK